MKILQQIQGDMAIQKMDMKEMEQNIKISINKNIDDKFTRMEAKTYELEGKIEQQQKSINFLERQIRKKNVVFFGVEEKERRYEELVSLILEIINHNMEIVCKKWEIESVMRIGKKSGKARPIVVTMSTMGKKIELLKNKKTLDTKGLYIKEDYPLNVLEKRKELQEQLRKEREAGKNVTLRYDKIVTLEPRNTQHDKTNTNKRFLSESPPALENSVTRQREERTKQASKKNKPQNITSFFRPPQLNHLPQASTSRDAYEQQKN